MPCNCQIEEYRETSNGNTTLNLNICLLSCSNESPNAVGPQTLEGETWSSREIVRASDRMPLRSLSCRNKTNLNLSQFTGDQPIIDEGTYPKRQIRPRILHVLELIGWSDYKCETRIAFSGSRIEFRGNKSGKLGRGHDRYLP